jgi:hypothetical protein
MERLTDRGYKGRAFMKEPVENEEERTVEIIERLAAYEDTGLSPADIPALTARAEAAEAERDACKADLKSMADWYRDSVCDDGICGWCKHDADHGLDGYANECAGFYKNDCFEWRGPQEAGKGETE